MFVFDAGGAWGSEACGVWRERVRGDPASFWAAASNLDGLCVVCVCVCVCVCACVCLLGFPGCALLGARAASRVVVCTAIPTTKGPARPLAIAFLETF